MSYSTKEIWVPCDSQARVLASTSESAVLAVQGGGANLARGLVFGVHIIASAADAGNSSVIMNLYSDSSKTLLLYSVDFDLDTANVGSAVHSSDTLATPIPVFETPYVTLKPGAATSMTFTTTFFVKTLA
tara:strand:- start:43 stop:432 length:390 start_codon:yes stop_codon:yes gene_type:complete